MENQFPGCEIALAWIDELGRLESERRARLEAHVASCSTCRRALMAEEALQRAWSALPTRQPSRDLAAALARVPSRTTRVWMLWPLASSVVAAIFVVATLAVWQLLPWRGVSRESSTGIPPAGLAPRSGEAVVATGDLGEVAEAVPKMTPPAAFETATGRSAALTQAAARPLPDMPVSTAAPTQPAPAGANVGEDRRPALRPTAAEASGVGPSPRATGVGPTASWPQPPATPPLRRPSDLPPTLTPPREPDLGAPPTSTPGPPESQPVPPPTTTPAISPPGGPSPSPQPLPTASATAGDPGRGLPTASPPAPAPSATPGDRGRTPTASMAPPSPPVSTPTALVAPASPTPGTPTSSPTLASPTAATPTVTPSATADHTPVAGLAPTGTSLWRALGRWHCVATAGQLRAARSAEWDTRC